MYPADWRFQSTLPVGGGTKQRILAKIAEIFQSTLPVGGGTETVRRRIRDFLISIHPPREGRDYASGRQGPAEGGISIHPPREGRDSCSARKVL